MNDICIDMDYSQLYKHGQRVGGDVFLLNRKDDENIVTATLSDGLGKLPKIDPAPTEAFLRERLSVYNEYMSRPFVSGSDLIEAGIPPAEGFSDILAYAHKLRLAGVDKESALKQTLAYAKKRP